MAKHPKFEVFKAKDDEIYFRLTATNGENILSSEGYKVKASALNGIESVRKHSVDVAYFEKKVSTNDKFYFNLKANNGQVIGTSQMYASESSREIGIASVTNNAPIAEIEDNV
jgi:uncharacterized protein